MPNTLTGEGNLAVDITFENMDDFSPAAVARRVEPLRKMLEARTELSNLMTWMDGKSGAENLIANLLQDPSLLQTLTSAPKPAAARLQRFLRRRRLQNPKLWNRVRRRPRWMLSAKRPRLTMRTRPRDINSGDEMTLMISLILGY